MILASFLTFQWTPIALAIGTLLVAVTSRAVLPVVASKRLCQGHRST